jgi:hypothetical protein
VPGSAPPTGLAPSSPASTSPAPTGSAPSSSASTNPAPTSSAPTAASPFGAAPVGAIPVETAAVGAGIGSAAFERLTCPDCGEIAEIQPGRRRSDDFCRRCDFPLFWARSAVITPFGENASASLRRLPGTVGRAATAGLSCPHCGEPNSPAALICIRCGGDMHPVAPPPPPPVVVYQPPPPPPVPVPEKTSWWWLVIVAVCLLVIVTIVVVDALT